MVQFEVLDYDIQVVVDDDSGPDMGAAYWSNKIFELVSRRAVLGRSAFRAHTLCMDRFMSGWGGLGFGSGNDVPMHLRLPSVWGKGGMLRLWRSFAWHHLLGAHTNTCARVASTGAIEMSIISKDLATADNKFALVEVSEFAAALQRAVHQQLAGQVLHVRQVSWAGMALKEQLATLFNTHVLLGLPGSDVMNGIFLRDDTLLILPCRLLPGWQRRRKQALLSGVDENDLWRGWGDLLWETQSAEAVLWLRHSNSIHLVEWCQHKKHNMLTNGVRLDAHDYVGIIRDWIIQTRI